MTAGRVSETRGGARRARVPEGSISIRDRGRVGTTKHSKRHEKGAMTVAIIYSEELPDHGCLLLVKFADRPRVECERIVI